MNGATTTPLLVLLASVGVIVIAIAVLRLHAFFALTMAAAFVALASAAGQSAPNRYSNAIERIMAEAGTTMGTVGFAIAMAAVIGMCLMESGAADRVIRQVVAVLGERWIPFVFVLAGFVLSAPVFIDTVIMLLLPLARSLSVRTGRNYLLYVLVICAGGMVSNGVVPPAPGPLFMAESLKLDIGRTILAGTAFGLPLLLCTVIGARWLNRHMPVPVRPMGEQELESLLSAANRPDAELPSLASSVAPVLVPMALMAFASVSKLTGHMPSALAPWISLLGNKNVALFVGGVLALAVYARQKGTGWRETGRVLSRPLETAGVIILVISAGGAYGASIQQAGVGESVHRLLGAHSLDFVLLGWLVAASMRAVQGSATIAVIASVGLVTSIAGTRGFGVDPMYVFLAIGFGSKFLAWMNDSGFWVISRFSGLTQEEMLRTWTILVSGISIVGLIEVLAVSHLCPRLFF